MIQYLYFDPYNIDSIKDTITKVLYDKKLRKIMIEKGLKKLRNILGKKCK